MNKTFLIFAGALLLASDSALSDTLSGMLGDIDTKTGTLTISYGEGFKAFHFRPSVEVTINGQRAKVGELAPGATVTITTSEPLVVAKISAVIARNAAQPGAAPQTSQFPIGHWTWSPKSPNHRLIFTDATHAMVVRGDGTQVMLRWKAVSAKEVSFEMIEKKTEGTMVVGRDPQTATVTVGSDRPFEVKRVE